MERGTHLGVDISLEAVATPANTKIRPFEAIGPLSLRMSRDGVMRALGRPNSIYRTRPRRDRQLVHYDYRLKSMYESRVASSPT